MNTPAHAVINLLILSRRPTQAKTAAIVAGGFIPDVIIILFYAWHLILGTPETQIWSVEYYRPFWQAWIDVFNSIPIFLIALLICWKTRSYVLMALFASLLLHALGDLPLHNDDAHRHFFPFSDWRLISPVSYWDPDHHGHWFSVFELLCVLAASTYLFIKYRLLKPWVSGLLTIYLGYWVYVMLVWA